MNIFSSEISEIVEDHLVIGEEYQMVAYTKDGMVEFKVIVEHSWPQRTGSDQSAERSNTPSL